MHQLWFDYTAVTFAFAGFAPDESGRSTYVPAVVTLGFWLFTLGHLSLLVHTIRILQQARVDISSVLMTERSDFRATLEQVVRTNNTAYIAIPVHLAIDLCATGALWLRFLAH